jgi:hypothetical protein
MTNLRLLAAPSVVALALAAAASSPALAVETTQTYPGAQCEGLTNTAPVARDTVGRLRNASAASQTVLCPVAQQDFTRVSSIEFGAVTATQNVSCAARAVSQTGGVAASTAPNSIIPLGAGLFSYQFGLGDGNVTTSRSFFYQCVLPAGGIVVGYSVVENINEQ